ncbi:MAG: tRNA (N6-threonylcarbamoyladenosine(37)-N6)-methyltransferase TrmO [Myxococcales bacterium]|nr:tRNA (N6-threonylcarbamoyladenosine(37)-N6)-methyltransferase TrmO [Myxococcales bacterium]
MATFKPIGFARTSYQTKAEVPRQAGLSAPAEIELLPETGYEHALEDLASWSHLWVLFHFHQVTNWRPKVLPPRSEVRRGVFATRSPHRPNPIGLSAVRLIAVRELCLEVAGLDLVDGTPILDLKPYVPYSDCIPVANSGWLPEASTPPEESQPLQPLASVTLGWQVHFSARASSQLALLAELGEDLGAKLETLLETGPSPRPYRRIRLEADSAVIAFGAWRARFIHDARARSIEVLSLATGYREAQLTGEATDLAIHRALVRAFGYPGHG